MSFLPRHESAAMDMSGTASASSTEMESMSASMMEMTFFSSTSTPLYSSTWKPQNIGTYAATCIFLIALAVVFRFLIAVKAWKEAAWLDAEFHRRYVTVANKLPKTERLSTDSKRMILTENGVEEEVMVVKRTGMDVRPWRISIEPIRAVIDTLIAGVGYLLMLAIMTMNVGYFLSVLGGTFLGSLALGRYAIRDDH
ncbi:low affinity copper transporter [Amylocarpus encephaloides]|uniref:Copper transport protein n=1 Tax=Amylocarpus encephaloides TaxID=45428 RepID=A0A9P8C9T2_9HELO|nr:low affinity copper transporter [Amylocarpus encephaloides]